MINSIKNLFTGILSFLTGILGGKKSQKTQPSIKAAEKQVAASAKPRKSKGYFMELDEADEVKPVEIKQQAKVTAPKMPEPVVAAKPAKTEPAKTPDGSANAQAAKVELVQTAEGVKAVPAKPAKALLASANGQSQTETTFAPKYLSPSASSNGRRRPGPNMNPFLDMARQVKSPS